MGYKEIFSEGDIFGLHNRYHKWHKNMKDNVIYFKEHSSIPYVKINGVEVTLFSVALTDPFIVSEIQVDDIVENTNGQGVNIESINVMDGQVTGLIGIQSDTSPVQTVPFYPIGEQEDITGPGAFSLLCVGSSWTSTGTGDALTLADAVTVGHIKKISYVDDGGDTTDTGILVCTGYTSITFNAVYDRVELMWIGDQWVVIDKVGCTVVPSA